ncbi:hypothetical protein D3C75_493960 [compost metagenome]
MIVTPVLHFKGQCEEAIALYQKAFDFKPAFQLRYRDADSRDWDTAMTEEELNYIYHSEGHIGGQRLMMADELDQQFQAGTANFLTITFDTAEQVRNAFQLLQEGGTVIYPLRSTTYSSCMGTIRDKFGFRWGLMTEQTEK